ncbi:MAG: hypothetical protein ACREE0_02220 [Phenylobacterium sp.]
MIRTVAGIALSLGIATSAMGQEPAQNAPPSPPATEPASQPAAETPPSAAVAPTAKGRIVFFRPTRLPGAIYTYHVVEVAEDGKAAKDAPRLGDMPNGGGFALEVDPGIHSYNITGPMAVNKAEDRLRMEVEPGETYYVEQTVRMGLVTGGFRLVPADEARLKASHVKLDAGGN